MKILGVFEPRRLGDHDGRRPWRVSLVWEPRDLWVGVYWAPAKSAAWVMVLPTLGFKVEWARRVLCSEGNCMEPAYVKCVRTYKDGTNAGDDWPRDALCVGHGNVGFCSMADNQRHVIIPDGQVWAPLSIVVRKRKSRTLRRRETASWRKGETWSESRARRRRESAGEGAAPYSDDETPGG